MPKATGDAAIRVPRFIFIGGPDVHAGYVRQLFKAERAGRLSFDEIVVVDQDASCAVASLGLARVRIETAAWNDWLGVNLSSGDPADHLVPYHWAPHVLLDWLSAECARHGFALTRTGDDSAPPPVRPPVERSTKAGDVALSYAEWICPPTCIEPALCPHTRGPKSWSLASELASASDSFVFPCLHLTHGVGTIPLRAVFEIRDRVLDRLKGPDRGPIWISSASHCHGLAARVGFARS